MKIFLAWSGERSKAVAKALHEWLPEVIQGLEPWMSEEDIEKGTAWNAVIRHELQRANFGIVCSTPENQGSQWLHFEAGALSKIVEEARVCPYLFGLSPAELQGPLAELQYVEATFEDTRRMVKTINGHMKDGGLKEQQLNRSFERCWAELEKRLKQVTAPKTVPAKRSQDEMLEEILNHVRSMSRRQSEAMTLPVATGMDPTRFMISPSGVIGEGQTFVLTRMRKRYRLKDEREQGDPSKIDRFRAACSANGIGGSIYLLQSGLYEADLEYSGTDDPRGAFGRVVLELEKLGYVVDDVGGV